MLEKLNRIKNWQAALIIAILGLAVYSIGLRTPFQGDDLSQIVNNVQVHSLSHIKLLFEGGTFYNGQGLLPLTGHYYRPLMMVTFAVLYTLFGPDPLYFHLFQLFLCIGSSFILYLFFRYSFKPLIALFLALLFMVHPLDSQVVFAIPSMQDALFFFFGILALYLLLRIKSTKSLIFVVLCLFLSLLAKESGILFVVMAFVYLFWWDRRKRLYSFTVLMILPISLWLVLKVNAIGLNSNPNIAPIDNLDLYGRIMTAPSLLPFYLTRALFPLKLASGYYWIRPTFSYRYVLLPFIVDLVVIALIIYLALLVRKRANKAQFYTFLFFTLWSAIGLLAISQIIPLDRTACDTWFYFVMVGLLGMVGVILTIYQTYIRSEWFLVIAVVLIGVLGVSTSIRGTDWKSPYTLAIHDVAASNDDFNAMNEIAYVYINQGNYAEALPFAERSVRIYPDFTDLLNLGDCYTDTGNYTKAFEAFSQSLKYGDYSATYENMGALTLLSGSQVSNKQFFIKALNKFPQDGKLWLYYALFEDKYGDNSDAKISISNAAKYDSASSYIYSNILNNQPFIITLSNGDREVHIP